MPQPRPALALISSVNNGMHSAPERQRAHLENALARKNDLVAFANGVLAGPASGMRNEELKEAMRIVLFYAGAIGGDLEAAWHEGELAPRPPAETR